MLGKDWRFLLKIMGLSLFISALIKFGCPRLEVSAELTNLPRAAISIVVILLPSLLLALILGVQLRQFQE